ncbi:MAG: RdgB/HAM1 family non-canonical purine NTP pyrophosphatase [Acidimicrobiales bacterium]|nr:RdgB/HAM1 family non-canonical purine NTP pyrophosphatase [Acidimicrobiales bacterium]
MDLVLATNNPGKVSELRDLLAHSGVTVMARPEHIPHTVEDADTLTGNAAKKAREVCAAVNKPALADDTGLFVDALDGAPGVQTARFGGWEKLLTAMDGIPVSGRLAQFRTVVVVAYPDGRPELEVEGTTNGVILTQPRGDRGFGYDPVFVPNDGDGRSFAEMTTAEKNSISHRGRALQNLLKRL